MLSGIGPADAPARAWASTPVVDLPVGQESAGSSRRLHDLYAAGSPAPSIAEMRLRPHGVSMIARLFVRHRAGDGRSRRPACLHQDPAGARGAGHRVHVPRHRRITRICGFRCCAPPSRTASASARRCCIRKAAARCCCVRPTRARAPRICLQFLHRPERSADAAAKASGSRARSAIKARSILIAVTSSTPGTTSRATPRSTPGSAIP